MSKYKVWECKIVVKDDAEFPPEINGFDSVPRRVAIEAVEKHGIEVLDCFSGWGGSLSEIQEHLVDKGQYKESKKMTRQEHLAWCKQRALEYVDSGDNTQAYASMTSDLNKHPETEGHGAISLGMALLMSGQLSTAEQMRKFIEGFN